MVSSRVKGVKSQVPADVRDVRANLMASGRRSPCSGEDSAACEIREGWKEDWRKRAGIGPQGWPCQLGCSFWLSEVCHPGCTGAMGRAGSQPFMEAAQAWAWLPTMPCPAICDQLTLMLLSREPLFPPHTCVSGLV